MINQKILRKARHLPGRPVHHQHVNQFIQTVLKITQKDLITLAGQKLQNMIVIFRQMLQQMTEDGFRRISLL